MQFVKENLGKYEIVQDTLEQLKEKFSGKDIVIIVVCGAYRTGKSFLLNRLLGKKLFRTSPTVNSETKGLYVADELIDNKFLLVDVEGLGATDVDDSHDTNLFVLSLLLANVFIYNSVGPISSTSLKKLEVANKVANTVSKSFHEKSGRDRRAKLLWICRDFSLDLVERDGTKLNPKQYIERAIHESDEDLEKTLKKLFSEIDACILPTPENVKNLDLMRASSQLDQDWEEGFSILKQKCFSSNTSNCIDIDLFLSLANNIIDGINNGQVPVLTDVWKASSQLVRLNAENAAENELRASITKLPVSTSFFKKGLRFISPILTNMKLKFLDDDVSECESFFKLLGIVEEATNLNDSRCLMAMQQGALKMNEIFKDESNSSSLDEILLDNCPFFIEFVKPFISIFGAQFSEHNKQLAETKLKMNELAQESSDANSAFQQLRQESTVLKQEMTLKTENDEQQILQLSESNNILTSDKAVIDEELNELKNTLQSRTVEFDEAENVLKSECRKSTSKMLTAEKNFSEIEKELISCKGEHEHLQTQIETAVKNMRARVENLQTAKTVDDEKIKAHLSEIESMKLKIVNFEKITFEHKEVLIALQKEAKNSETEHKNKLTENATALSQISTKLAITTTKLFHNEERLRHAETKRKRDMDSKNDNTENVWLKKQHVEDLKKLDESLNKNVELRKEILEIRVSKLLF